MTDPNAPQQPDANQPVQPSQPVQQGQPVQPGQPGQPVQPGQPGQPVDPTQPYAQYPAAAPKKKRTGIVILSTILVIVVGAVVSFGVRALLSNLNSPNSPEAVAAAVEQIKEQYDLPQQIDQVTVMDDITAEGSAIHYFYTVKGADPSLLSEQALSDAILPQLCAQPETKELLDNDIDMKYSYVISETGDEYDLSFSKEDC